MRIFITGGTGVMGSEGLRRLVAAGGHSLVVLARDSSKNRKFLAPFMERGVEVIWGDLLDREAMLSGLRGADMVLHIGGMVSPAADWYPEETLRVNVGAMELLLSVLRELGQLDTTAVVYIGSVAQYEFHDIDNPWGGVGDPQQPAKFDAYALSKIRAEELLRGGGLRRWVSLRQSGILHAGLLTKVGDPITFHVPLRGVLEWTTVEDSGEVLASLCSRELPESFWNRAYNIGSGARYRMTNYEFECRLMKVLGCPPPEKIFERRWFATRNFHGMWFRDSDELEELLHFREGLSLEDYFGRMVKGLPWYFKFTGIVPAWVIKLYMGKVARTPGLGPMDWIAKGNKERIEAAWGSLEEWQSIGDWDEDSCISRR
ncbi:MAG: NAD(P)-dependent oxidoreductase [Clostridium sp.]|nr:NAD(P)-dependent oxidoreductase [Prevotella sp.]MCM1429163.1 NAD(P)-dependent oxidoreductase [Clostridium sp.]MCM1475309.1 NAD(P)-dependent oxidoreductase [Muribaculaceae bacterium]